MKSIAFVCQRYGDEVNGGAEFYCRQIAEHLCVWYDVHVYTTCAVDYITWKNEYAPGISVMRGVTVHRFPVKKERQRIIQGVLGKWIRYAPFHSDWSEKQWVRAQGPLCDEAIEALWSDQKSYEIIFFMTYLYYLTAVGAPRGFHNACLIPTLHDEWPAYLRLYNKVFSCVNSIVWNSPEEKAFASRRFADINEKYSQIIGIGIDVPTDIMAAEARQAENEPYIVYVGRIDESKGCKQLFDYFCHFKELYPSNLKLLLVGRESMEIPRRDDVVSLGFISEEQKFRVMKNARGLVLCSQYESLSMVVLESMLLGRPVLVNGKCEVLKGHIERGKGGIVYYSESDFQKGVLSLLEDSDAYRMMSHEAHCYVENNYQWSTVLNKYRAIIENKETH